MKVLIIGGGACGASAAARLRRLDDSAQITILEKTQEISIANCGLPYYCSDVIDSEEKMQLSVCFGTSKGLLTLGKTAENLRVNDWSAHQPIEIGSCQSSPARS